MRLEDAVNRFKISSRAISFGFRTLLLGWMVSFATPAQALTYTAPVTELDHFRTYSWRLNGFTGAGGVNLATATTSNVSVSIVFNDIRNWRDENNSLFVHMFDTATNAVGTVASTRDESDANQGQIRDSMRPQNSASTSLNPNAASEYSGGTKWQTTTGGYNVTSLFNAQYNAQNTFLFRADNFDGQDTVDYRYDFNAAQVANFLDYISAANGGDISIGMDSDCHYYFTDLTLIVTQSGGGIGGSSAVPEPASLTLLGIGLLAGTRYRNKKRKATTPSA